MNDQTLEYVEVAPPRHLQRFVRCIWYLRGVADGSTPEPVIPDGCVEIVLNRADPFQRHDGAQVELQPLELVAGQLTCAISLAPTGRIDLCGIRFQAWSAAAFLGLPAGELRDRIVPLDALPAIHHLLSPLSDCSGAQMTGDRIGTVLRSRAGRVRLPDGARGVVALAASRGLTSTRTIAQMAGWSVRRVQQLFAEHVGVTPKELIRIVRLQRALGLARAYPDYPWARIAAESGYYDHAHLLHDTKQIAGSLPSQLVRVDRPLTDVFISKQR